LLGLERALYVGSNDYNLYSINPDGSLKWKFRMESDVLDSSPAIGLDGTVYVGNRDGYVYALSQNGALKWKFKTGGDNRVARDQ